MNHLLRIKFFLKQTYILGDIYKILTLIFKKIKIAARIKDICFMYLALNLYPKYLFKFSTRKLLPDTTQRHRLNKDDFLPVKFLSEEDNKLKYFDEVNFVGYGTSFNIENIKKFKNPTFLISFWSAIRKKKDGSLVVHYTTHDARYDKNFESVEHYNNKNLYYVVARKDICQDLIKNNCNLVIVEGYRELISGDYILSNNYKLENWQQKDREELKNYKKKFTLNIIENFRKPYINNLEAMKNFYPNGSFVYLISSIIPFCNKINIYGWDFYLDQNASDLSSFQLQKTFFNPKFDWGPSRSWFHFESTLVNYYYAYLFSKNKKIKIHSRLGGIEKHKKLLKNIEKALFI